jgi:hypothetical protein
MTESHFAGTRITPIDPSTSAPFELPTANFQVIYPDNQEKAKLGHWILGVGYWIFALYPFPIIRPSTIFNVYYFQRPSFSTSFIFNGFLYLTSLSFNVFFAHFIKNAVYKLSRPGSAVFFRDLNRFIDCYRGGDIVPIKKFIDSQPQYILIDQGDPVYFPVRRVLSDNIINALKIINRPPDQIRGKSPDFFGSTVGVPKISYCLFHRWTAPVHTVAIEKL